jgi:8-oxo-dGTP pyrophosphatase MutT (NUDIX family)
MTPHKYTVIGLVFNENKQILLIKHKKQGKWLPPGGHVEENESPCAAVAREVLEETGVPVQVVSSVPELGISSGIATELPLPLRITYIILILL